MKFFDSTSRFTILAVIFFVFAIFNAANGEEDYAADDVKRIDPKYSVHNITPLAFLKEKGMFMKISTNGNRAQMVNYFDADQIAIIIEFKNQTPYDKFTIPKENKFELKINDVQTLSDNIPSPGGSQNSYYLYLLNDVTCKGEINISIKTEDDSSWSNLALEFSCGE